MQEMKKCKKCGVEKPDNKEHFVIKKAKLKEYITSQCKECQRLYNRKYRTENKNDIFEQRKNYRKNNSVVISERKGKYYVANKSRIIEKSKLYYKENSASILVRSRLYCKEYKSKNKDVIVRQRQRRKSLKRQLPATLNIKQWRSALEYFDYKCCYCGQKSPLTQDHFIPLSKGGEYTRNNIIPACGICNSSKGSKDFFEWYQDQTFYSKEREILILSCLNQPNRFQELALL
ncbi:HNH endonuclease [Paenibacillus sp. NPDC101420]|uniref:HNH endonuclease n=1 Tax=Paenibacillus sp. NPDC101420 TaxID=3390602 RepID=UPI003CFF88E2